MIDIDRVVYALRTEEIDLRSDWWKWKRSRALKSARWL